MDTEQISLALSVVRAVAAVLFLTFLYWFQRSCLSESLKGEMSTAYHKARERMTGAMQANSRYQIISSRIYSSGLHYKTGGKITPLEYEFIRFLMAVVSFLVFLQIKPLLAIPAMVGGFFLLDMIMSKSNELENEEMLHDIETIYNTIKLQTDSGVYIVNAIYECHKLVKTRRLARALLELSTEIAGKQDIEEAVDHFKQKFRNQYLNILGNAVKQSMITGDTSKIMGDVSRQIDGINEAALLKEENKKEAAILLVDTLMFAGIVAAVMYVVFISMGTAFSSM